MKRFFSVLLLLILVESAYAEYVTILPVNSQSLSSASSELVTLSELYGRNTTIRYMTDETSPANVALNNTNIYPSDSLTLTEDVLMDNKLFGFYVGAARQVTEGQTQTAQEPVALMAMSFTDSEADYQSLVNKAKAEAGSNIALAKIIEEQINRASDSELLALDTDLESDNTLLTDDRTSSLIDTLLSGGGADDYNLPIGDNNIIISGLGGGILTGGGSGSGDFALADGSSNVPEPSTWGLLVLGVVGLAFYRKRFAR
ncbi:MAG: PEP-CTERM sorting domain-containing protein [Thermoguttaceae bacterium]|nr:PEP-CTERM sorting domain-containing protein [Thermoguttaceae bacterium]